MAGLMVLLHFARVARVFVFSDRGRTKTGATRVNSKKCYIFQQQRMFVPSVPKEGRNDVIRHCFCNENICLSYQSRPSCPSFRPGRTRFVSHRRRGLQRLLYMWPVFINAYENVIADNKKKAEIIAKLRGLLIKFRIVKVLYSLSRTVKRADKLNGKALEVNKALERECDRMKLKYIDNSNIDPNLHLNRSGLHLTYEGTRQEKFEFRHSFFVVY